VSDTVTLEFLGEQMKQILAGQSDMRERFDVLTGAVNSMDQRLSAMELNLAIMRTDMTRVYGQMASFDKRLDRIEQHLGLVKA
jgi:predicted nuclease with TOPRIM domain